jgi:hypothetical protein
LLEKSSNNFDVSLQYLSWALTKVGPPVPAVRGEILGFTNDLRRSLGFLASLGRYYGEAMGRPGEPQAGSMQDRGGGARQPGMG